MYVEILILKYVILHKLKHRKTLSKQLVEQLMCNKDGVFTMLTQSTTAVSTPEMFQDRFKAAVTTLKENQCRYSI